jgi:hypothetical protein
VSNKIDDRQQTGLVRALGPLDATMIVMGSMIGHGGRDHDFNVRM